MTRITVKNKSRVPVRWGGHFFPARAEKEIDVPEERIPRIRSQRRLRVVAVGGKATGEQPWGTKVDEAKAYVGEDTARAVEVLEAENASDKPRVSLVRWLESLLDDEGEDEGDDAPEEE